MKCPRCESIQLRKNGRSSGKQRYLCKACGKQFIHPLSSLKLPNLESEEIQIASNGHSEPALIEGVTPILSTQEVLVPQVDQVTTHTQSAQGIAILLLDAENLKLDINSEKFLATLCTYPLQVKIAFANWRNPSVGKQDAELYDRGYQLVHVPGGQNGADAKMIAVGSSICFQYPTVKEVFVCSSDSLLTHLCNQLQNHGLTVHRVRRQDTILTMENCNTGESKHYSLAIGTEIPSLEWFVKRIEELLKVEHESINERIAQFSTVANLFQERRNLTHNVTPLNASPMVKDEQDSITPVREDDFTPRLPIDEAVELKAFAQTRPNPDETAINSIEELEKVLIKMIKTTTVEARREYISVTQLKKEFQTRYKEIADSIVKKFKPNYSLIKFLRSRPTLFKLTLDGTEYQVAVCEALGEEFIAQP
jgi:hypothetical protein